MDDIKLAQPMEQYKREHWCALLRVPMSGNAELDAIILAGLRVEMAAKIIAGMISSEADGCCYSREKISKEAISAADNLLAALFPKDGGAA